MSEFFSFNERLGIPLPEFTRDWDQLSNEDQEAILFYWEQVRGSIPDRISDIETIINEKQDLLSKEANFTRSCELNNEIAELASVINDLLLWYRTNQTISNKVHH